MNNYERYFGTIERAVRSFKNNSSLHVRFQRWLAGHLKELDVERDYYVQWLESEEK